MKTFEIYIKNHADGSDYEDETQANSLEEAVDYFYNNLGDYGWDKKLIAENVREI